MPHNLLRYVFDRSSGLRRLYLSSYTKVTNRRMSEILKRLPFLEELHLDCPCNFKKTIEIAGRCCPQLKSLKLINKLYMCPKLGCNEDALAVADNIPGLRHLQLHGPNKMTSIGLLVISENCPHLESLDVWLDVPTIGPVIMRRLSQQIKDLRLSYDYDEDCDSDLDLLSFLSSLNDDDPYELSDISTDDDTDDLESLDEDDSSGLSDTNTASDYYDDSEFSGGSDGDPN